MSWVVPPASALKPRRVKCGSARKYTNASERARTQRGFRFRASNKAMSPPIAFVPQARLRISPSLELPPNLDLSELRESTSGRNSGDRPRAEESTARTYQCSLILFLHRVRRFPVKQHSLIQIYSSEFSIVLDYKCGWRTTVVVAGEHSSIDEQHFSARAGSHVSGFLHRVAGNNVCGIVSTQDFRDVRGALFLSPLVITAKPKRAIFANAKPTAQGKELFDPG